MQKYYDNESRFNGVYSRDNLPKKIKDEAYVILVHIGLLYFLKKTKLFISIAWVLSIFLKKLKSLLEIKT